MGTIYQNKPTITLNMIKLFMFSIIMLTSTCEASANINSQDQHKRSSPSDLSVPIIWIDLHVPSSIVLVTLWCINRSLNCNLIMYQTSRIFMFSIVIACNTIILEDNELNILGKLNGKLRSIPHIIMIEMYYKLNVVRVRAVSFWTSFTKIMLFSPSKKCIRNIIFFENFLLFGCFMLLTRNRQKMEYVASRIKILVVMQKKSIRATKTTWHCLSFKISRSLSGPRLVLVSYPFQCVSPHFRYNFNMHFLKGEKHVFSVKKQYQIRDKTYRTWRIIITLQEGILFSLIMGVLPCLNGIVNKSVNLHTEIAFIMIMIHLPPND